MPLVLIASAPADPLVLVSRHLFCRSQSDPSPSLSSDAVSLLKIDWDVYLPRHSSNIECPYSHFLAHSSAHMDPTPSPPLQPPFASLLIMDFRIVTNSPVCPEPWNLCTSLLSGPT